MLMKDRERERKMREGEKTDSEGSVIFRDVRRQMEAVRPKCSASQPEIPH